jgi:Domain of unknown function (DUF4214)
MNPFRRLFGATSRKSSSTCRPPLRLRTQLALEGLETRLVPTTPPIGLIRPPLGGIALPEFVVPESQPVDSSHFHSISAALGVFANPLRQGTVVIITIEPGASPDPGTVSLTQSNSTVMLTVQGDPNVPAAVLPGEQIQLTGSNYTLTNLNLESLTLGKTPADSSTFRNLVSNCLIQNLIEDGIETKFTQNTITGSATFNGLQLYQTGGTRTNDDQVINNTFTSEATPVLSLNHCDGTIISGNHFYFSNTAINMINCGETGPYYCIVSNNTLTANSGTTGILILQEDDHGDGAAAIYVSNNIINTNAGNALVLICQDGDSQHFDINVQGNDFHNNAVGVAISGGGANQGCGVVDLGGPNADPIVGNPLGVSLGGNDFRGFTSLGTLTSAAIVLMNTSATTTVSAANNIFSPGVHPPFVVDDGVEGSVTGTGQINATALDNAHAYVQGLYNDVLGRTGTMAELNAWVNVLNSQGQAAVANGILRSGESLGRIVDSLYLRFLGRNSDAAGRASWVGRLQQGATLESVEAGFLTSPEYLGHIDTDFVQSLYINILGRTGSAGELAAWNNQIQTLGLAGIANGFLTSQEFRSDNVNTDFASFIHSPPSATQLTNFVGLPTDLLGIEAAILSTQQCFNDL